MSKNKKLKEDDEKETKQKKYKVYTQHECGVLWHYRIPISNGWLEFSENQQSVGKEINYYKKRPSYKGDWISEIKLEKWTVDEIVELFQEHIREAMGQ